MKKQSKYFSPVEVTIWCSSVVLIIVSFCVFDRQNYLTLAASLIGASSLIFNAKGNPVGQALMIVFSVLYGIISYRFAYYGEMITYLGMTMPMAIFSLAAWLKNPHKRGKAEVKIKDVSRNDVIVMTVSAVAVTVAFYFILRAFNTKNLILSTLSVTTSYVAAFLTFKRNAFFALVYALNDAVLIALWILASFVDKSNFSVIICFVTFMVNDVYAFINWCKMRKRQKREDGAQSENNESGEPDAQSENAVQSADAVPMETSNND